MSKFIDRVKHKLSAEWEKVFPPKPTIEGLLTAAEAADTAKLEKMMAMGGADLLQWKVIVGRVYVPYAPYLVEKSSPAAFELLMTQPQVGTLARKIFLRNAVYHNKPELAEILLKDSTVGDRAETQKLLQDEYIIHHLAEERTLMGQLLVKYGADNEAAQKASADFETRRRQEQAKQAEAWNSRLKAFGSSPHS